MSCCISDLQLQLMIFAAWHSSELIQNSGRKQLPHTFLACLKFSVFLIISDSRQHNKACENEF